MRGKVFMKIATLFLLAFIMVLSATSVEVQAQKEKVGWVGPVYKELSDSLT